MACFAESATDLTYAGSQMSVSRMQVATAAGAHAITTAGSPAKRALLRRHSCAAVHFSRDTYFADNVALQGGVSVIVNSLTSPGARPSEAVPAFAIDLCNHSCMILTVLDMQTRSHSSRSEAIATASTPSCIIGPVPRLCYRQPQATMC